MNFCRRCVGCFIHPEQVLRDEPVVHSGEAPRAAASFNQSVGRMRRSHVVCVSMLSDRRIGHFCRSVASEPILDQSLESLHSAAHPRYVSTKQIVQDLLERLPETVSLHEVAQEIEFVAGVRQGLAEIERGERISVEDIERELPSWVIR